MLRNAFVRKYQLRHYVTVTQIKTNLFRDILVMFDTFKNTENRTHLFEQIERSTFQICSVCE
jgi:hypothetical protein